MYLKMTKNKIVQIVQAMGFHLDLDRWSEEDGWMRFQLKNELDERDLRLIWWKNVDELSNFKRASDILFKAGQKAKIQQLNEFISL